MRSTKRGWGREWVRRWTAVTCFGGGDDGGRGMEIRSGARGEREGEATIAFTSAPRPPLPCTASSSSVGQGGAGLGWLGGVGLGWGAAGGARQGAGPSSSGSRTPLLRPRAGGRQRARAHPLTVASPSASPPSPLPHTSRPVRRSSEPVSVSATDAEEPVPEATLLG